MPKVFLLCGIPASGKTTFWQKSLLKQNGVVRLSLDDFRFQKTGKEFWPPFEPVVKAWVDLTGPYLLAQGYSIAIDATNIRKSLRMKWIKTAKEHGAEAVCYWFNTSWNTCVERNEARDRKVPMEVLRRMSEDFESPNYLEGFEKIVIVEEDGTEKIINS
jgi:predicted kinase